MEEQQFVAKQLLEWLGSGAIAERRDESKEELERSVEWIRGDLRNAGMQVNEEKSNWEPSQSGEESALHSRHIQQVTAEIEEIGCGSKALTEREEHGSVPDPQAKTGCDREMNGVDAAFSGERREMLTELEEQLRRAGREDLIDLARTTLERSVAPSTLRAYQGADRSRRLLARACGMEEEADLSLCLFVLDAIDKGKSRSTVATAMASFGFMRGEDPHASKFGPLLGAASKLAAKTTPSTPHPKAPREDVEKIVEWAVRDEASPADLWIGLMSLMGFAALLRAGEIVALRKEDVSIKIGDAGSIQIGVNVRRAKNDQEGKGRTTFFSISSDSAGRKAWVKYCAFLTSSDSPYFFPSLNGSSEALKTDFLRKELSRACEATGVGRLVPHSLRGGGATASIEEGASLAEVQRRGRWKSANGMAPYLLDSINSQGGTLSL